MNTVALRSPLDGCGQLPFAHGKRDELLDSQMHRFHQQMGIEYLRHQEEARRRELPGHVRNLDQHLVGAGVKIDNDHLRRIRLRQQRGQRFDIRELRHRLNAKPSQEPGQLLPVSGVRVDDDACE